MYSLFKAAPWWVGPPVIFGVWVLLCWVVPSLLLDITVGPSKVSPGRVLGPVVANVIAPVITLAVGAAWLIALRGRQRDAARLDRQTGIASIRELDWRAFEKLLGEAFRRQGYRVAETPRGADGGVDLVLERGGRRSLVQCKHYRKASVGVAPVRELAGVVSAEHADEGIFAASGRYTADARAFATKSGVRLIDGVELEQMIAEVQRGATTAPPAQPARGESRTPARAAPRPQRDGVGAPPCPACGEDMVQRTARKGRNAGNRFWGCPGYPRCRGTRPI